LAGSFYIYRTDIKRRYYSFVKSILWHRFLSEMGPVLIANVKQGRAVVSAAVFKGPKRCQRGVGVAGCLPPLPQDEMLL
jgi:hypothetical protein